MPNTLGDFPVYACGGAVGSVTVSQNGLMTVFDCACRYTSRDILRLAAACRGQYASLGVVVPENDVLRLHKSFSKNALAALGYDDPRSFHLIRPGDVYAGGKEDGAPPADDGGPADNTPLSAAPEKQPEPLNDAAASEYADMPPVPSPENEIRHVSKDTGMPPHEDHAGSWKHAVNPGSFFSDSSLAESCAGVTGALTMEHDGCTLLAVPVSPEEPFPLTAIFCFGSSDVIGGREYIVFKTKDGNLTL